MIHKLDLSPLMEGKEPGGILEWNEDTGEVSGYEANKILSEAERLKKLGSVSDTPLGLYSEKDPLRDREAMAILLISVGYKIPEQLQEHIKVSDRDIPDADY